MSSAAEQIKANAARLRQKPSSPATTPGPPTRPPRQKLVRRTVDLAPATHRALDAWQSARAEDLGLARVTGQQVLAALIEQLLHDDALAEQITNTIAADQ